MLLMLYIVNLLEDADSAPSAKPNDGAQAPEGLGVSFGNPPKRGPA